MNKPEIWAIVPAAGIGKRMLSDIPKQYLSLNGHPVLEHTLNALLDNPHVTGLVIALNPLDQHFSDINIHCRKPVITCTGGNERADSVLNAISELLSHTKTNREAVRVLVHDAVRACIRQADINKLINEVGDNINGGLLAIPVRDTMKRQQSNSLMVFETVDRKNLWHALTPQYFHAERLLNALKQAESDSVVVTDESSAMEAAGYSPLLVEGYEDNIKITRPDDLRLASLYLKAQQAS